MDTVHDDKDLTYLNELLDEGEVAMLTTRTQNGHLRSRPMATAHVSERGEVFFFTMMDAALADELTEHDFVNLSYIRDEQRDFVSITGVAQLQKDQSEMRKYWRDTFEKWVPGGLDEPNLALLKIAPLAAEHWGVSGGIGIKSLAQIFSAEAKQEAVHERLY